MNIGLRMYICISLAKYQDHDIHWNSMVLIYMVQFCDKDQSSPNFLGGVQYQEESKECTLSFPGQEYQNVEFAVIYAIFLYHFW